MTPLSASFGASMRVHFEDRPGAFADLARAIADTDGLLGAIDLVRVEYGRKVRDVTVFAPAVAAAAAMAARASGVTRRTADGDAAAEAIVVPTSAWS